MKRWAFLGPNRGHVERERSLKSLSHVLKYAVIKHAWALHFFDWRNFTVQATDLIRLQTRLGAGDKIATHTYTKDAEALVLILIKVTFLTM